MNKIFTFQELPTLLSKLKQRVQSLVLVGGCFDILHIGHVRFLRAAKKYGILLVALESDESLTSHKGHLRPIHKQEERAEVLVSLQSVNYVLLLPHFTCNEQYHQLTSMIHPSCIACTEGDPLYEIKKSQADAVGAKIVVIPKINTPSTTQLAKLLALE